MTLPWSQSLHENCGQSSRLLTLQFRTRGLDSVTCSAVVLMLLQFCMQIASPSDLQLLPCSFPPAPRPNAAQVWPESVIEKLHIWWRWTMKPNAPEQNLCRRRRTISTFFEQNLSTQKVYSNNRHASQSSNIIKHLRVLAKL